MESASKLAINGIGKYNGEEINNPFFEYMIKNKSEYGSYNDAYYARDNFNIFSIDDRPKEHENGQKQEALWCFKRFGMTDVKLKDGSIIYIGGEHEDYYDPDFYVYNDVIFMDKNENIKIYGYPLDTFPPTDFHISILYNDYIYILRNEKHLHYTNHRFYKLNIKNFKITKIEKNEIP